VEFHIHSLFFSQHLQTLISIHAIMYSVISLHSLFLPIVALPAVLGASLTPDFNRDTDCVNSASDRSYWSDGFDISTNYYENVPDTGVTREYWFNVENTTASPDGVEMPVQLINGSFPGPTIIADSVSLTGETLSVRGLHCQYLLIQPIGINQEKTVVHLTNSLPNNGSRLHFHGIRQN
jgi:hypothetical protein